MPEPILPGVEMLVRRRAAELAAKPPRRPRRRLVISGMGGVAVAAVCSVLFLVIGSPSGGGLLSPQRAVAAVIQSLEGTGVLHWVQRGDLKETPEQFVRPGTQVEELWVDLTSSDHHLIQRKYPAGEPPSRWETWRESGLEWTGMPIGVGGRTVAKQLTRTPTVGQRSIADELLTILERGSRGEAEVTEVSGHDGVPLVLVTDRQARVERRLWISREVIPRVVQSSSTILARRDRRDRRAVTITKQTLTWQILPHTAATLADVEIPPTVDRIRLPAAPSGPTDGAAGG